MLQRNQELGDMVDDSKCSFPPHLVRKTDALLLGLRSDFHHVAFLFLKIETLWNKYEDGFGCTCSVKYLGRHSAIPDRRFDRKPPRPLSPLRAGHRRVCSG